MSDQLSIAGALRKLTDEQLVALAKQRSVNTTNMRDLYDFAEVLSTEKSIRHALANLNRTQLDALMRLSESAKVTQPDAIRALELAMLIEASTQAVFPSVANAISQFSEVLATGPSLVAGESLNSNSPDVAEIDRDARMAIFELQQAITEVVFDLQQRYIREVGKSSIGLPELKRLAADLNKTTDYARRVFELSLWSQVATIMNGRWQLGSNASQWLALDESGRFELLANNWQSVFGADALLTLPKITAGASFTDLINAEYPLAIESANNRVSSLTAIAETIGLTHSGFATSWLESVRQGKVREAAALVSQGLPASERRLIVQADLSLISPSPLPTDVEIELRGFAVTEHIGLATTYRMSAMTVANALENGTTVERIANLLEELSGKPLPQPVTYLLADTQKRFGRIKLIHDRTDSVTVIDSADKIVLTEIKNDSHLKPLALHFDQGGRLVTRFEVDIAYFALREAGHIAIRMDDAGEMFPTKNWEAALDIIKSARGIFDDIHRMRQADNKIGSEPDDDDLVRQLQLAIKLKSQISVTLDLGKGKSATYLVEPVGLANGRLRAKDRRADVERTLPLSSVMSIELVG